MLRTAQTGERESDGVSEPKHKDELSFLILINLSKLKT